MSSGEGLPLVLKVEDVRKAMRISKTKVYEIVAQQDFPKLLCGRVICVPRDAFLRWLEAQATREHTDGATPEP
jgi:hypothetical protein